MSRLRLAPEDLARIRFAISPLWEARAAFAALTGACGEPAPWHRPWLEEARAAAAELDLAPIAALTVPGLGYVDVLTPPPEGGGTGIGEELERLRRTPPEVVRRDVLAFTGGRPPPDAMRPYLDDPEAALDRLAEALRAFWDAALEPHWPRLRAVLEADVEARSGRLARAGPAALLTELGPAASYRDGVLSVRTRCDDEAALSGRGLLLIPSAFHGPLGTTVMAGSAWQESLQYGARGVAGLWEPAPPPGPAALRRLLGEHRARLLVRLQTPATTGRLAALQGVTPGAISQQLSWLREAGLSVARRRGRHVVHGLSDVGRTLLAAYGALDDDTDARSA